MNMTTARIVRPPNRGEAFDDWLTRAEACDLLGVSINTIMNWERKGLLTAKKTIRGSGREIIVYDPHELARCPRRFRPPPTGGDLESRAFELFEQGAKIPKIVIDLRRTSDEVIALRERWLDLGGADRCITEKQKLAIERHVGKFDTVDDLIENIAACCTVAIDADVEIPSGVNADVAINRALDAATAAE